MSSSLRRGVAAAFFAFSIAGLTACGAGHDADTNKIRPDNASAHVEDIKIQNVNVILPDPDEGPAAVSARLFNDGDEDQVLESVELPDSGTSAELSPAEGEGRVVVPAHGSVALGGEGNPAVVIQDPSGSDVALGNAQRVVFVLSDTGDIELRATVVSDGEAYEHYADWGPSPAASEESGDIPGVDPDAGPNEEAEAGDEAGETGETGEPAEEDQAEGTDDASGDQQQDGDANGDEPVTGESDGPAVGD
ncbi:DUF461 domain-containing protein [Streptomyces sp. NPDC049881]|uniref:DUF461 domain-containing protein n=1 Tax=Streptomyces sp. NPDC049881 TaxID=3155778 RepID=UPI0034131092